MFCGKRNSELHEKAKSLSQEVAANKTSLGVITGAVARKKARTKIYGRESSRLVSHGRAASALQCRSIAHTKFAS
jgi:hypothetical protein